jgi:Enoyl-CoA hydratase/carnithine racemase
VTVTDAVALIEFHRPDVCNALNNSITLDLHRAFGEIQVDRSVGAVVVTGKGEDAFSAGASISQHAGTVEEHDPQQKDRQQRFYGGNNTSASGLDLGAVHTAGMIDAAEVE